MPKKPTASTINQTALGNENIQVVGSNNVITRITNLITGDAEQQRAQRNRQPMLELVKNTWIKGVWEKSLYNEVLIDLGMEERSEAVDHPWDIQVQMPDRSNRTLSPGTSIIQVFSEMNKAMLILGEPGSGKTTMLLDLLRELIARAEQDDTQSIPVLFNLSSWSNSRQTIDIWLVNELNTKYNVPNSIAQKWVKNDELQILLDGLDEVSTEKREVCVNAINAFRKEHGLTVPIAVCSRSAEYEMLNTNLNLESAVLLLPLTSQQIDAYMNRAGPELKGLRRMLQWDTALQELARQPLLLSIMILAYRGIPTHEFENEHIETLEGRRKHLFNTYIEQMYKRAARTRNELYSPAQTNKWLIWLAKSMQKQNQSIFYVELMQPLILSTYFQRLIVAGVPAFVGGLSLGWLVWRLFQPSGLDIGWLIGMSAGTILAAILFSFDIKPVQGLVWSWSRIVAPFRQEIILPLSLRLSLLKLPRAVRRSFVPLVQPILTEKPILPLLGMIALSSGAVGTLVGAVNGGWVGGLIGFLFGVFGPLSFVLLATLFFRLVFAPFIGLSRKEITTRAAPNEGIHQSARSAIISFLIFGLDMGLIFGSIGRLFAGTNGLIRGALFGVLLGGLIGGLWFGGAVSLQHIILRLLVWRNGSAPLDYVRFLNYCAERIFLRRVGGGYIFIHRLLMEHFAAMYPDNEK